MNASKGSYYLKTGCISSALLAIWLGTTSVGAPLHLASVPDSVFPPPTGGAGDSSLPIVSPDGRFVLFASTADNLVSLGTNLIWPLVVPTPLNVFVRDRTHNSTVLVSINLAGTGGGNADSIPIGISTNGQYVLFESVASNVVAGDTNNAGDVFLRDIQAGVTRLVSASTNVGFGTLATSPLPVQHRTWSPEILTRSRMYLSATCRATRRHS
jgi:hypothetical protein